MFFIGLHLSTILKDKLCTVNHKALQVSKMWPIKTLDHQVERSLGGGKLRVIGSRSVATIPELRAGGVACHEVKG